MRRALVLTTLVVFVHSSPLGAYTPESPEVQQMVHRGVGFIARNATTSDGGYDRELGAICVAALAQLQAEGVAGSDLVGPAVKRILREKAVGFPYDGHSNYSLPLATILLCFNFLGDGLRDFFDARHVN